MTIELKTRKNAPEAAQPLLKMAEQNYGFLPNLFGMMANSPALLKAYVTLSKIFEESSLTPVERQVVLLSVSHQNNCTYCVSAHLATARMAGVPMDVIRAIREGANIEDRKLEALRMLAVEIVETRGFPSDDVVSGFVEAGYAKEQVLDVILGVALKTMSNYTNHFADTPLDKAFQEVA